MNSSFGKTALLFILFFPLLVKGQMDWYLAPAPTGNDGNDCLLSGSPCATLAHVMTLVSDGDDVHCEDGSYGNGTIDHTINLIQISGTSSFGIITLNADIGLTVGLMEAAIIYVNPGGVIQDAIDFSPVGGYIDISTGTYNETITIDKNLTFTSVSNPITIQSITIDNGATLTTDANMTITGSVILTDGIIDAQAPFYMGIGASDIVETSSNYVIGTVTMLARTIGTGSFSFLGAANAGGNDLGNVSISRTTGSNGRVTGVVSMDESIDCTWQIISDNPPSIQVLTFLWFSNWDNGIANQAVFNDNGSGWSEIADIIDSGTDPRVISTSGINVFGEFTVAATGDALPVELTYFKASHHLDYTLLQWQTASEINHDYFEIQRSEDGENFEAMGRMSSHHNATTTKNYEWKDFEPISGKVYYRLKMVDYDGYTEYSPIVSASSSNTALILHPNPTSDILNIQSAVDIDNIEVYNTSGRRMALDIRNNQVDVSTLLPGIYILKMISNSEVAQTRFIKE